MDKALLQFSIGPVQSFISQARKLQDLYTGSKLLSELSEQAIEIAESNEATIIFPGENIRSKPNVFLAELDVEGLSEEHIKSIGQDIETEVKNIYIDMLCEPLSDDDLSPKFDEQIANHLSINWLIYPYDSEEQTYDVAFNEIQKLFQEIKKTRTFTQYKQQGRICSMLSESGAEGVSSA
jgi:CRISPR-associated protein Cmr2